MATTENGTAAPLPEKKKKTFHCMTMQSPPLLADTDLLDNHTSCWGRTEWIPF
ncbi:hypothetical protein PanWU01x14_322790, partial [Parasponia andersonii]